jgi:hypothetical protein
MQHILAFCRRYTVPCARQKAYWDAWVEEETALRIAKEEATSGLSWAERNAEQQRAADAAAKRQQTQSNCGTLCLMTVPASPSTWRKNSSGQQTF